MAKWAQGTSGTTRAARRLAPFLQHSQGYHTGHPPFLCFWPGTCKNHSHEGEGEKIGETRARGRESASCYRKLGCLRGQKHEIHNFPSTFPTHSTYQMDHEVRKSIFHSLNTCYALYMHLLIIPMNTLSPIYHLQAEYDQTR